MFVLRTKIYFKQTEDFAKLTKLKMLTRSEFCSRLESNSYRGFGGISSYACSTHAVYRVWSLKDFNAFSIMIL